MEQAPTPESRRRKKISASIIAVSFLAYGVNQQLFSNSSESTKQPDGRPAHAKEETYPIHKDIATTVFWAGEESIGENDSINNIGSYWTSNWVRAYGGVDDPDERCGFRPRDFTPKENPFYFALPFGEFGENGTLKDDTILNHIPWYTGSMPEDQSPLKNR